MASGRLLSRLLVVGGWSCRSAKRGRHKTPPYVFGLDARYAGALYSAAVKLQLIPAIERDLATLKEALMSDMKLKEILESPGRGKVQAVTDAVEKLGLSQTCKNFLAVVAENGRLSRLEKMMTAFSAIVAEQRGDLRCQVIVAKDLDQELMGELQRVFTDSNEKVIKLFGKEGQKILLEVKTDPQIIGGMMVSIGDRQVDMTIATKINKYVNIIADTLK